MKKLLYLLCLINLISLSSCDQTDQSSIKPSIQETENESTRKESKIESTEKEIYNDISYEYVDEQGYYVNGYYGDETNITIPSEINEIPVYGIKNNAFINKSEITQINLPSTLVYIGVSAFIGCSNLTSIAIPEGVTILGSAFYGCCSLTNIELPSTLTSIGSNTFYGCNSLTNIEIPNGVTYIGDSAFKDCSGLTNIVVPNSVTSIGEAAFSGCSGLEKITLPFVGNLVGSPFGYVFGKKSYPGSTPVTQYYRGRTGEVDKIKKTVFYLPTNLTEVTITGGDIFYGAFYNCTMLTSITLGDVMFTDYVIFYNCSNLTNIEISSCGDSIHNSAFNSCKSLTNITLPESVKVIWQYAFAECYNLTYIIIKSKEIYIYETFGIYNNLPIIYFSGTPSELIINEYSQRNFPMENVYFYSETQPTSSGNYWYYDTDGKTPLIW